MESSRPGAPPAREPRRYPVAPIVFGVIAAVVAVWITVVAVNDRDPEATVEAYLTAITEKDVDGALALVSRYGYGVPYGDTAVFLSPEAIGDDWWVVSVTETDRVLRSTATVKAVLGGPGGTAEGVFTVDEHDGEWLMSDPFVRVRFPPSPLAYIRVNDKVVPRPYDLNNRRSYVLFPGTYRFYESVRDVVETRGTEVVAAFPPSDSHETTIVPAALTPGRETLAQLQKVLRERIDECARFATQAPYGGCPFATDGEIDTPDGKRVTDLHGLTWKVTTYPVAEMTDQRTDQYSAGFTLRSTEPGAMALSGSGTDSDGNPATFTVTCRIDLTGLLAGVGADGKVALVDAPGARTPAAGTFNTCLRNT
ncbi:hypothetical protein [Actinophytocola glycyrrhizae]|uniref:Uncharacterized protein n=1 Tax=Actinophytocola glycyrrhizae TaxID=2044873 RepID=A0ABV9RSZ6_9PSEU